MAAVADCNPYVNSLVINAFEFMRKFDQLTNDISANGQVKNLLDMPEATLDKRINHHHIRESSPKPTSHWNKPQPANAPVGNTRKPQIPSKAGAKTLPSIPSNGKVIRVAHSATHGGNKKVSLISNLENAIKGLYNPNQFAKEDEMLSEESASDQENNAAEEEHDYESAEDIEPSTPFVIGLRQPANMNQSPIPYPPTLPQKLYQPPLPPQQISVSVKQENLQTKLNFKSPPPCPKKTIFSGGACSNVNIPKFPTKGVYSVDPRSHISQSRKPPIIPSSGHTHTITTEKIRSPNPPKTKIPPNCPVPFNPDVRPGHNIKPEQVRAQYPPNKNVPPNSPNLSHPDIPNNFLKPKRKITPQKPTNITSIPNRPRQELPPTILPKRNEKPNRKEPATDTQKKNSRLYVPEYRAALPLPEPKLTNCSPDFIEYCDNLQHEVFYKVEGDGKRLTEDGMFLIRRTTRYVDTLLLCVKRDTTVFKFPILYGSNQLFTLNVDGQTENFASLIDLLENKIQFPIVRKNGAVIKLHRPPDQ